MQLLRGKSGCFWCCWGLLSGSSSAGQSEGWVPAARCATLSCLLAAKWRRSVLPLLFPDRCSPTTGCVLATPRADPRLWTRNQTSIFITMIQARPCIWNLRNIKEESELLACIHFFWMRDANWTHCRRSPIWVKYVEGIQASPIS